jgi:antitoxin component YwqK of YwqJK toxin-antitoxin module
MYRVLVNLLNISIFLLIVQCNNNLQSNSGLDKAKKGKTYRETYYFSNGVKKQEIIYDSASKIDSMNGWYKNGVLKYSYKIFSMDTIVKIDSFSNEMTEIIETERIGRSYYDSGKLMAKSIVDSTTNNKILCKYSEDGDLISRNVLP